MIECHAFIFPLGSYFMLALLHSFCKAVLKEFIVWQVTVLLSSLFQIFIALCGKECRFFLLVRHRVFFFFFFLGYVLELAH